MWKQKIGLSLGNNYDLPTHQVIGLLAETGFDAVSPVWDREVDMAAIAAQARQCGLEIQSIHAPTDRIPDLWSADGERSSAAQAQLLEVLDACRDLGVPVLVVHAWDGFDYTLGSIPQGLESYSLLAERAKALGIRLAIENLEGEQFLFALMAHFEGNDTVGYCWDSGHELCYNQPHDLLGMFGDRLFMTHINDNLGVSRFDGRIWWTDDLHLLPYDGIADWDRNILRLRAARKQDILNFEVKPFSQKGRHEGDGYAEMPLALYLAEAYKRACRIAYRYSL